MDARHVAQILVGIAQAQSVVIQELARANPALTSAMTGALQARLGIGTNAYTTTSTLSDLPTRLLLQLAGGVTPPGTEDWATNEVARIIN